MLKGSSAVGKVHNIEIRFLTDALRVKEIVYRVIRFSVRSLAKWSRPCANVLIMSMEAIEGGGVFCSTGGLTSASSSSEKSSCISGEKLRAALGLGGKLRSGGGDARLLAPF